MRVSAYHLKTIVGENWTNCYLLLALSVLGQIAAVVRNAAKGEIDTPCFRVAAPDHECNPLGIQWQRYGNNGPWPDHVKKVPCVIFAVNNLDAAFAGQVNEFSSN